MKVLTIGREEACDIFIDDPTNQISRRHALLRIYPFGKMEIVPLGRNSTYLNGKELVNEKAHRVKKSDVVSLARVKNLDWKSVPNPYSKIRNIILSVCALIICLIGGILLAPYNQKENGNGVNQELIGGGGGGGLATPSDQNPEEYSEPKDSTKQVPTTKKKFYFPDKTEKADKSKEQKSTPKNKEKENKPTEPQKKEKK